jgi:hypothetical protein
MFLLRTLGGEPVDGKYSVLYLLTGIFGVVVLFVLSLLRRRRHDSRIMSPAERRINELSLRRRRMNELSLRRSELKRARDYRGAIPFQLEIIELIQEDATPRWNLANAHNYASVLYFLCALYTSAEWHAHRALSLADGETSKGVEARGAYNWVLARILAAQYRFEEALPYGEAAVRDYSEFHNPPDEFLSRVMDEVEQIRLRTWSPPPD